MTPRPDTSAAGSRSARSCRWAKRASATSVSTNGSAAHRQEPDPASEVAQGPHPGEERWEEMPEPSVAPVGSRATNERGDYDDHTRCVGFAMPHDRHGDGSAA